MMNLVEIANTEEDARRQAIEELGFNRLHDLPQMRALLADEETQSDVQAAAKGNIAAVWRLQKNPHILKLLEAEEIANMVKNGLTSKQAGALLGLSEATIRKHRRNIRKKLDIAGKQQNLSSYLKTL